MNLEELGLGRNLYKGEGEGADVVSATVSENLGTPIASGDATYDTNTGAKAIQQGQSGYDTGKGYFMGYSDGVYKLSIGDSDGSKLLWDGEDLTITGTVNATSGFFGTPPNGVQVDASGLLIVGTGKIRTATSGRRIELVKALGAYDDGIFMFDSDDIERVRIQPEGTYNLIVAPRGSTTTAGTIIATSDASYSGDMLRFQNGGTGDDIEGTNSTWTISKTGDAVFNSVGDGATWSIDSSGDASFNSVSGDGSGLTSLPDPGVWQYISSSNLRASANTLATAQDTSLYIKKKEIKVRRRGTIKVEFSIAYQNIAYAQTVYAKIYVNGVAVGTERSSSKLFPLYDTFTEDISVAPEDLVQVYLKCGTTGNPGYVALVFDCHLYWDTEQVSDYDVILN